MSPLERLFSLEVEYHRTPRAEGPTSGGADGLRTSYAISSGYDLLLKQIGGFPREEVERLRERFMLAGDARNVLAAGDSLKRLLCIEERAAVRLFWIRP
jgi:hypothetical protein